MLRKFRDDYLKNKLMGRIFIRIYYKFSPILAKKLKSGSLFNCMIRSILSKFVEILKRRGYKI